MHTIYFLCKPIGTNRKRNPSSVFRPKNNISKIISFECAISKVYKTSAFNLISHPYNQVEHFTGHYDHSYMY